MNRSDDDVEALRAMARELGIRPTPPPAEPVANGVDDAWVEDLLGSVIRRARQTEGPVADDRAPARHPESPQRLVPPVALRRGGSAGAGRRQARSPVRRGWFALAAAVALLVVVGGSILGHPQPALAAPPLLSFTEVAPAGPTATSGQPARDELLALAQVAGEQPARPRSPLATVQHVTTRQWRLEVTRSADEAEEITVRPTANDSWLGHDGTVRLREVATASEFSPTGELLGASKPGDLLRDETVRAGERGASWPSTLPRDPDALFEELVAASQDPGVVNPTPPTSVLLSRIEELFGRWVVPADLTESLWLTLADQPDMRYLGRVTDRAGRSGQGFSHWNALDKTLEIVIIDPNTGDLLATEGLYFPSQGTGAPTAGSEPVVSSFTTYVSAEWVGKP